MAKKQTQSSSLLISLAGPAVILAAYAAHMRLNPSVASKQIERLEGELAQVEAARVDEPQRLEVAENLRVKNDALVAAKSRVDSLRRQAGEMMRGSIDAMQQLELGQEVNRVLAVAGLRLIDDRPVETRRNGSGMSGTLSKATKKLGETLTKLASDEVDNTPIQLPTNIPRGANPAEWMAAQRALRVGKFDGPQTRACELKLVGDYRSMVAGLEAVVDTCPTVVVTSVGFEKPAVRTQGALPLIWNVQLQMRPMPSRDMTDEPRFNELDNESFAAAATNAGSPRPDSGRMPADRSAINEPTALAAGSGNEIQRVPIPEASAYGLKGNRFLSSQAGPERHPLVAGQTYTVAKPAVERLGGRGTHVRDRKTD